MPTQFQSQVLAGEIPVCRWVRLAVERHQRDLEKGAERGLRFDEARAMHALQFFQFLRHSKGEWAGQRFTLLPWEAWIIWVVFGWVRNDGLRRFRTTYISVPRKNGKTTLAAGVGLYLMVADGEPGAEVYSAATKRAQARLTHEEATEMVRRSPELATMVKIFRDNLHIQATRSKFEPLGADADTMDGLNVHGAIIDELHAHPNRKTVDVLSTATGARRQPLIWEITTAGVDRHSICFEHELYTRHILEGVVTDDSWFGFISTIDEGDDWLSPDSWAKANLSLGVSVKLDDLQRKADQARQLTAAENTFRQMHLNQWVQQSIRWIPLDLWDANAGVVNLPELERKPCYGGLDLSSVRDLTAWVLVFPWEQDPETVRIVARFWCPRSRLTASDNPYAALYRSWEAQGLIEVTVGDAVNYEFIKAQILLDARRFNIQEINVDRLFQGYQLSQELADEGLQIFGMGQGFLSMAVPMHEFERRLLAKKLWHGGNPVLRFMADNMAVQQDPAGNLKPDKANSQGRIDGIVALVMALDRQMRNMTIRRSAYEDHGVIVV